MGSGISLVNVQKGIKTRLKDLTHESLGKSEKYVWSALNKRVKRKAMSSFERDKIFSNLTTQTDFSVFEKCPLVIEAVFEDLKLKQHILEDLEKVIPEDCVFASNTSALPISQIAAASKRPENVLGMHYFSPVEKMPLLEIIVTEKTSDRAASLAVEMGMKQGKTVIVVNDGPGFYTTRILVPFMDEASIIALEGSDFHFLNKVMKEFGFPVGPITLCDEVGLDVGLHIAHDLKKALGNRLCEAPPELLDGLVKNNMMGRKSGKGFFLYKEKSKNPLQKLFGGSSKEINPEALKIVRKNAIKPKGGVNSVSDIQKRIAYRMINESALCLQEGIIKNPVDGDIGAVFGLGFPPIYGGPFRYLDLIGVQNYLNDMKRFEGIFGERFKAAQIIEDYAKENKKFHN
jgi:enoyl-CoA hydratase/long-chain 3-hydroxyacyl-CoA dehydrogenase